jgi:hypothetical protein
MIFRRDEKNMGVRLDATSATNAETRPHGHFLRPLCHHQSHNAVCRRFRATVRHSRAHSRRVVKGTVDRSPCRSLQSSK